MAWLEEGIVAINLFMDVRFGFNSAH